MKGEGIKKLGPSVEGPQRWKNPSLAVPQDGEVSQIVREREGIVRLGGDRAETKEGRRLYWSSVGQRFTVERGGGGSLRRVEETWKDVARAA